MPYIAIQTTQTLLPQQAQQLADGVTDIMVNLLHKKRELVAVSIQPLHGQWFINAQANLSTAFMQAYITANTNTEIEKAQAQTALFNLLETVLGKLSEATYIVLHNVPATDWGYSGQTQAARKQVLDHNLSL